MPQKLTPEIIVAAIAGFEAQKISIDSQIAELRSMLDGRSKGPVGTPFESGTPKRRRFSLASRRKMAAAQKARWAGIEKDSEPPKAESAKPKKRKMSAAGRAAIAAAVKKRWAAVKAAKQGKPAVAGRKKTVPKKSVRAKKTATAPEQSTSVSA